MRRNFLGMTGLLALVVAVHTVPAWADSRSATMAVSAVVTNACSVVASPVAFGTYEPTNAAPLDATGQIAVTCSMGTPYSVGLSAGASADVAQRRMSSGAGTLSYNLYQDSAHSITWGSTTGADTVSGTYVAAQPPLTVHGRIAGGQAVAAGAYTDSVTVTVTY